MVTRAREEVVQLVSIAREEVVQSCLSQGKRWSNRERMVRIYLASSSDR